MRSIVVSLTLLVSQLQIGQLRAETADAVFLGEHIITMEASTESSSGARAPTALAVKGERIVWVGNRADAEPWIAAETEVIELGERALLPGFIDAHGHLLFMASTIDYANVSSPPVGPATDINKLRDILREHIKTRNIAEGEWVIGYGYDDSLLQENRHPTRADLDAVSTRHPIVLAHVSGHLMTTNSAALEKIGYTVSTQDPEGGHIRRMPGSREPNGVVEETATMPLRRHLMPGLSPDLIKRTLSRYAAHGITTVQDGASSPEAVQFLSAMAAQGVLNLDVVAYPVLQLTDIAKDKPYAFGAYDNRFRVGGVKLVLDGSPQGKTAWLSEPYHVPPPGKAPDYRGYPTMDQETTDRLVDHALSHDIQLIAHANGDATADSLLASVQKSLARRKTMPDHRTVMIHAQTVRNDQLDRMQVLGVMPSFFSAHTFYWGDWHRDSVLGDRAQHISPTRSTLERGIPFTVHNDAPVVPPDMIRLLWATTNRLTRSGKVLGDGERIPIRDALAAMTRTAAWQYFEEDSKGTLSAGKLADLVVLDQNPLNLETKDLLDLKVLGTWSHGRTVYASPGFAAHLQ